MLVAKARHDLKAAAGINGVGNIGLICDFSNTKAADPNHGMSDYIC